MSGGMAALWDREEDQPPLCAGCAAGDCSKHQEFFHAEVDGVIYGPFSCDCLCDPANIRALLDEASG